MSMNTRQASVSTDSTDEMGSSKVSTLSNNNRSLRLCNITKYLEECEKEGALCRKTRVVEGGLIRSYFKFVHDKVQEAAYQLVVSDDASFLMSVLTSTSLESIKDKEDGVRYQLAHFYIGRTLYEWFSSLIGVSISGEMINDDLDAYVYLIVDQLIRGFDSMELFFLNHSATSGPVLPESAIVVDGSKMTSPQFQENEKTNMAHLCARAGEKCMYSNDFKTSIRYFEFGLSLLDIDRAWKREYRLVLSLHNTIAEASCCDADFVRAEQAASSIIENGRNLEDKLRGYMSQIYALGAQMKMSQAIDVGLFVIKGLGEKQIPRVPGPFCILSNIFRCKIALGKFRTDTELLRLPDITEQRVLNILSIMNLLLTYSILAQPELLPVISCRMVLMSLKYGLSAVSARGFSGWSLVLNVMGDYDQSHRFSRFSIDLLDRYPSAKREWIPRIYMATYSFLEHWKEPIWTCYDKLYQAYRTGLECGDNEFSYMAISLAYQSRVMSGLPLAGLEPIMRELVDEMKICNQKVSYEMTSLAHECALVMMGRGNDPIVQNGALMNLEQTDPICPKLAEVTDSAALNYDMYYCHAAAYRMSNEYHFGNLFLVLELGEKAAKIQEVAPGTVCIRFHAFYYGMAALTLARELNRGKALSSDKNRQKWTKRKLLGISKQQIKILSNFAKHCPSNNRAQLLLLEAEMDAVKKRFGRAMNNYTSAEEFLAQQHQLQQQQQEEKDPNLPPELGFYSIRGLASERHAITLKETGFDEKEAITLYQKAAEFYEEWGATAKVEHMKAQGLFPQD